MLPTSIQPPYTLFSLHQSLVRHRVTYGVMLDSVSFVPTVHSLAE